MKIYTSLTVLLLTPLLLTGAILDNVTPVQSEVAEIQFVCDTSFSEKLNKKVPTTIALKPNGKILLIKWVRDIDNHWTPQRRCDMFSENINRAYKDGTLKFITSSRENGNKVICTANKKGGKCENILMVLRPKDNPLVLLNDLKGALNGRSASHIEHSSPNSQIYIQIDWDKLMNQATTN